MTKWLAIWLLFLLLASYSILDTFALFKVKNQLYECEASVTKLQKQVEELYRYKNHFIRMLNVRDYPEVLGKSKEKKND